MSITSMGLLWAAAVFANAPSHDGSRLEEYGGQHRCNDDAVKAQVVRALGPGSAPYQANAIQAGGGKLVYDAKATAVKVGKATSFVSQPGASGTPSVMRLVRSGAGAATDIIMCRYRRSSTKAWSSVGTADLVLDGKLAKRMPAEVGTLGRGFALNDTQGESDDSVLVLVASGVDGKAASFELSIASHGLQRKKKGKKDKKDKKNGDAEGAKNVAKRILADAADAKWKQYKYNQVVVFPEGKEIYEYENKKFDCSYYVWLVYQHAGIDYDFTGTEGLSKLGDGQFVEVKTPQPGDLVVWRPELGSGGTSGHVGIVIDAETFWDNSGSSSVGISKFSWDAYDVPRMYIRHKAP